MRVPLLDLKSQYRSVGQAIEAAARRVFQSGHFILGDEVVAFERSISDLAGIEHAVAVSSGSDALLLGLMALGIGPGDEVITSALSFFATAGAIVRLGARPIFTDIDPDTFNLDVRDALGRVTKKTRAIIPVHLFGRVADTTPLRQTGIPIVEDAAQAVGARGLAAAPFCTLSFFPSKNLGAAGDAGMILASDASLAAKLRLLRAHGSHPKYVHHEVGGNFRMDALQAAILSAKLPFLSDWNARRRQNAMRYRELLSQTPLILPVDSIKPGWHVWHHFVVRAPDREKLRSWLSEREIETEVYYPVPLHLQPCFSAWGAKLGALPHAEKAASEVLALPIHPELTADQIDFVADQIVEFYRRPH